MDLLDRKLLSTLDKDASLSLGTLAKAIKRSKQFVHARLKRLEKENIVTGYHAIVDMSKLGYFTFRVYLKFQKTTQKQVQETVSEIQKTLKAVWTITAMHGKWDLALFLGVQNIMEFRTLWDRILMQYKPRIKLYNVAVYAPIHNFNRTFFLEKPDDIVERIYGAGSTEEIDDIDRKLIESYAGNVRIPVAVLARKLGLAPETVRKRIHALVQRKIIVGYNLGLNVNELGLTGYRVDLQLHSVTRYKELLEYCRQHQYIYQVNRSIGGADFEIECVVRDIAHLNSITDDIRTKFSDMVNDVEYFGFSTFHILKYIPD
jgi:DNA-binding Lrp family transcriptional regulator